MKPPLSSTTTTTIAPLLKITNPLAASSNRPISPVIGLNANQNLQKKLSGSDDLFNADGQALSKSTSGTGITTTASTKIQAGISNNDQQLKSNSSSTSSAILSQSQNNKTTTSTTVTAATTTSGVIQAQPKIFSMRAPPPSSSLVVGAATGAKTFKMIPPINVKSKMVVPSTSAIRKNNFNLTNLNNKASSSASITSSLFSDSDSTIDPEKIAKRKAAVESLKSLLNSTED